MLVDRCIWYAQVNSAATAELGVLSHVSHAFYGIRIGHPEFQVIAAAAVPSSQPGRQRLLKIPDQGLVLRHFHYTLSQIAHWR